MKRLAIALLLIIGLAAPGAEAGIITGDIIQVTGSTGTLGGGAFLVNGPGANDFLSFCLERNEYLSYNTNYVVKLAAGAVNGGLAGGNPDPIDTKTAYLYWMFQSGAWGVLDANHQDGLQLAIWRIEQELASDYSTTFPQAMTLGNATTQGFANAYYTMASNNANGTLYGVQVMQLWDSCPATGAVGCTGPHQDMLYKVPDGGATLMLLGGALMGLGALRRKFRQ